MEFKEIGKWSLQSKTEIYYDAVFRHYIVKNKSNIEIKPLSVRASFFINMDKQSKDLCDSQFSHLRVHVPRSLVCCVTEDQEVVNLM